MANRVKIEKESRAGCLSSWLLLIGFLMAGLSTLGYILGLFGYQLRVSGARMDKIDLETYIPLLVLGAILIGVGYGIGWLQKRKKAKGI